MNPQDVAKCFVRQRMLGSEAVYELLEQGDETSTAVVVRAPGLAAGSRSVKRPHRTRPALQASGEGFTDIWCGRADEAQRLLPGLYDG
jgi:hypothetical protein